MSQPKPTEVPWTADQTFYLLVLLETRPAIWDMSLREYRLREVKDAAFNEIATEMNMPDDKVRKKVLSLRSAYMRELNQCQKRLKSGAGVDEVFGAVKWKFFSAMQFMYKTSRAVDILVSKNSFF